MNKELQKQEAITRMKMLDIYEQAIREFEKEGIVNKSEHGGIFFWLDEDEEAWLKNLKKITMH